VINLVKAIYRQHQKGRKDVYNLQGSARFVGALLEMIRRREENERNKAQR